MRFVLVCVIGLFLAEAATAQFKKERLPEIGLPTFYRPRDFEIIPLQPGEAWKILYMREKSAEERGRKVEPRAYRPELYVVRIARKAAVSGPKVKDPKAGEQGKDATKPRQVEVNSLQTWMDSQRSFRGWKAVRTGEGKKDRRFKTSQYDLHPSEAPRLQVTGNTVHKPTPLRGYAYEWATPGYLFLLVGRCAADDYEELSKLWRSTGDKMKVDIPVASQFDSKKLSRLYRGSKLTHIPYRIRVRQEMVEGWKAEDTPHYIVVYHTTDQPLVRRVLRDLESIRGAYVELFPPSKEVDAVSTVRICADRDEYLAYGGAPRSAGYWNSALEELVLYDAEKQEKGQRPDDSDTFIVLYHEAFHQYIHYSAGELPPHSWFNEGYGDYFSGAVIRGGKLKSIGVNPWRVRTIQGMLNGDYRKPTPWSEIVRYTQGQYYGIAHYAYAQGWSMIYFLNESPAAAQHPEWAKILPTYFETLKRVYAAELEGAGEDPGDKVKQSAGAKARKAAVDAAFEGVDYHEIEAAWAEFTLGLEVPDK